MKMQNNYVNRLALFRENVGDLTRSPSRSSVSLMMFFKAPGLLQYMYSARNIAERLSRSERFCSFNKVARTNKTARAVSLSVAAFIALLAVFAVGQKISSSIYSEHAGAGQSSLSVNIAQFAGYILELPGRSSQSRYQQAVRDLVLDNPDALIGLTTKEISYVFENISLVRKSGASYSWQFSSESCVLDVYFRQNEGQALSESVIEHYGIRGRHYQKVSLGKNDNYNENFNTTEKKMSCLNSIIRQEDYKGRSVSTAEFLRAG